MVPHEPRHPAVALSKGRMISESVKLPCTFGPTLHGELTLSVIMGKRRDAGSMSWRYEPQSAAHLARLGGVSSGAVLSGAVLSGAVSGAVSTGVAISGALFSGGVFSGTSQRTPIGGRRSAAEAGRPCQPTEAASTLPRLPTSEPP